MHTCTHVRVHCIPVKPWSFLASSKTSAPSPNSSASTSQRPLRAAKKSASLLNRPRQSTTPGSAASIALIDSTLLHPSIASRNACPDAPATEYTTAFIIFRRYLGLTHSSESNYCHYLDTGSTKATKMTISFDFSY